MSDNKVDIAVQSYYNSGTNSAQNSSVSDVLNSLANGLVTMTAGGKGSLASLNNTTTSPVYAALNSFMSNDPNPSGKPKAYLNWILLDEQLKYVSSYPQSGAVVVGNAATLNTLGYTGIPITKNGYLYIWVSNETQAWDAFFDNLVVKHYQGPLLEETHYYPFGLTMAGISSKALKTQYAENKYRFQKQELQNKECSDGTGLEWYEFKYRMDDPQIGRFWQIDPLAESYVYNSTYAFSEDKVINHVELEGLEAIGIPDLWRAAGISSSTDPVGFTKEVGAEALNPRNWVEGASIATQIAVPGILVGVMTEGIGESEVMHSEVSTIQTSLVREAEGNLNLVNRANEIQSALSPRTQNATTTAVASATTSDGKSVTLVGFSENKLRPAQMAALKPGEVSVEGKGHAEVKILNHAAANDMTVKAVAASRPICPSCAAAIKDAGASIVSSLKITVPKAASDGTYVRPTVIKPLNKSQ